MMNKDVFLVIPNGAGAKETTKTAKDLNLKSGQKAVYLGGYHDKKDRNCN